MADDVALKVHLARWFQSGDELAQRRAYEELQRRLRVPREVLDALGSGVVDEVKQEVLVKLFSRDSLLVDAHAPVAFASKALRNALNTKLRDWNRRDELAGEVEAHVRRAGERHEMDDVEVRLDVARAVAIAETLEGKGRLAVLLTTSPDRISMQEWSELVATLPPPPPRRPVEPLEREAASKLLYPTTATDEQRLNSFDRTYKRACGSIFAALKENE